MLEQQQAIARMAVSQMSIVGLVLLATAGLVLLYSKLRPGPALEAGYGRWLQSYVEVACAAAMAIVLVGAEVNTVIRVCSWWLPMRS